MEFSQNAMDCNSPRCGDQINRVLNWWWLMVWSVSHANGVAIIATEHITRGVGPGEEERLIKRATIKLVTN